jgi:hypothetical protein
MMSRNSCVNFNILAGTLKHLHGHRQSWLGYVAELKKQPIPALIIKYLSCLTGRHDASAFTNKAIPQLFII